jgi:hypothetical protein
MRNYDLLGANGSICSLIEKTWTPYSYMDVIVVIFHIHAHVHAVRYVSYPVNKHASYYPVYVRFSMGNGTLSRQVPRTCRKDKSEGFESTVLCCALCVYFAVHAYPAECQPRMAVFCLHPIGYAAGGSHTYPTAPAEGTRRRRPHPCAAAGRRVS